MTKILRARYPTTMPRTMVTLCQTNKSTSVVRPTCVDSNTRFVSSQVRTSSSNRGSDQQFLTHAHTSLDAIENVREISDFSNTKHVLEAPSPDMSHVFLGVYALRCTVPSARSCNSAICYRNPQRSQTSYWHRKQDLGPTGGN